MARVNAVDILGIGAQKSATSWAAHALNLQPSVWIPRQHARAGKEVSFFDVKWEKGRDWYKRIMVPPRDGLKTMDVSPGYTSIGPRKVAACKEMSPDARVFLLLRNPVDRDWSSLVMQATRRSFEIKNASFVDTMVFYDAENVARFTTYDSAVRMWRQAYGSQLFIGMYDDLCADSHGFYQKLCKHVGLEPDDVPDWRTRIEKRIFPGPEIALPSEMLEFLGKKYRPMVLRLQDLLDRDLSAWMAPPVVSPPVETRPQ